MNGLNDAYVESVIKKAIFCLLSLKELPIFSLFPFAFMIESKRFFETKWIQKKR